ncbi:MAG: MMPL family transporter, partial [Mariprofundaceae bacterium]
HTIMPRPPATQAEADALKQKVLADPLLAEKLASGDGKGLAIFVPIKEKMISYRVSEEIRAIVHEVAGEGSTAQYHIAGLPVAEDTFGHDMFLQMAISAPLAGLVLCIMLWWFFRHWAFVAGPMMVAMVAVITTMGALIGAGFTVHIMSSMIPIFLMPIAVVNSVHILSHFFDHYQRICHCTDTLNKVIADLFKPMLYTTLTTVAGFGSLALTPIPPVQVFGMFVAFGVLLSWAVTLLMLPAFLVSLGDARLGRIVEQLKPAEESALGNWLPKVGRFALGRAQLVIVGFAALFALGFFGMSKIVINDNPVNWFKQGEPVRVADAVLNRHFAGTYSVFLRLDGAADAMKRPDVARWVEGLQQALEADASVGKTSSYVDLVKRVNWAMHDEDAAYERVPDAQDEIAQYLFLFGMSGNPRDLDHFIDYEAKSANVWIQLTSGDNSNVARMVGVAEDWMAAHPAPAGLKTTWAGLTYINMVWQDKMVSGMMDALLGSYAVVFVLMLILFRSVVWAVVSMLPLTFTIAFSYGVIGLIGKSYDMPVAVLSSLALGLSVDFAIHFIERYREERRRRTSLAEAVEAIFGETGRAIAKNALVVSIGFTPLLFAPLVPYITVGVLLASIMALSWVATMLLLPALIGRFRIGESKEVQS